MVRFLAWVATACVCARRSGPNIAFVIFDDLRVNASGVPLEMPELERAAASGVSFSRAFASYPVCAPSRSIILSGALGYQRVGARAAFASTVAASRGTVPQWFRAHGYVTMGGGKVFDETSPLEGAVFGDVSSKTLPPPIVT